MTWILIKRLPLTTNLLPLSQFLRERGLVHRITEEQGEQVVYVADPSAVEPLTQLLEEFLAGRVELPVADSSAVVTPAADYSNQFFDARTSPWQTPISLLLIALSLLGLGLFETQIGQEVLPWFTFLGLKSYGFASLNEGILAGEFWRLLTPAFLHFGFFHFLFNSLWLWDLGRRLELGLGRGQYLLFVVITAIAANLAQYWWGGAALFGGMSGVVYALVGFLWVRMTLSPKPVFMIPKAIIGFMLFWLVLCMTGVVSFFMAGSIANAAHLGGLVAGAVWGVVSGLMAKPRR